MKLYGGIASPYVARVVMYAKIKGIDLPPLDAPGGNIKSPEYLALNPIGKMPTLDVNGQGIGESTIICDYLEDVYPQKSGLPKDPVDRARSRLVARIVDLYIAPAVGPLFRQMNPATRDAAAVEKAAAEMTKAYGYVEHAMGSGPFCVGNTPTLGDCALGPSTKMMKIILAAGNFGITDPTASGRLATWYKAVESHADTGPVLTAYATAFEGFMKMMAARRG
ncbi:MAG: glutathione S-transferase family protein [Gammaproteobacteria bacterium]|nr:glutathione S-transferase family protein [Gammaproteobacteria bacterium]